MKTEIISFIQTFIATFIIEVAYVFSQVPTEQVANGEFFTKASLISIGFAAGRSALKLAWQKTMPEKLGGVSR